MFEPLPRIVSFVAPGDTLSPRSRRPRREVDREASRRTGGGVVAGRKKAWIDSESSYQCATSKLRTLICTLYLYALLSLCFTATTFVLTVFSALISFK